MKPNLIRRCLLLCSLASFLAAPVLFADAVEDKVTVIRALHNQIERAKLRTKTIAFEDKSITLEGKCTLYYSGDEIVKIHLGYDGWSHERIDEYFYYTGGRLFFVYGAYGYWSFTGEGLPNGERETIDFITECRVYFDNGAVIRHLEKSVKSKDPKALKGILAKAKNVPSKDADQAIRLAKLGGKIVSVKDAADVKRLICDD